MGYQNETGERIQRECYVETALSFYQFAKRGTDPAKQVKPATARAICVGVTVESQLETMTNSDGYQVKRTGFPVGEIPEIVVGGIAYVKLGSTAGANVPAGTVVMSDADGFAVPYTVPTVSVTKDGAPTTAEVQAILASAITEARVQAGVMLDKGSAGDLVRINVDGDEV